MSEREGGREGGTFISLNLICDQYTENMKLNNDLSLLSNLKLKVSQSQAELTPKLTIYRRFVNGPRQL